MSCPNLLATVETAGSRHAFASPPGSLDHPAAVLLNPLRLVGVRQSHSHRYLTGLFCGKGWFWDRGFVLVSSTYSALVVDPVSVFLAYVHAGYGTSTGWVLQFICFVRVAIVSLKFRWGTQAYFNLVTLKSIKLIIKWPKRSCKSSFCGLNLHSIYQVTVRYS